MKFFSVKTGQNENTTVCEYCMDYFAFRSDNYEEHAGATDLETGEFVRGAGSVNLGVYENELLGIRIDMHGTINVWTVHDDTRSDEPRIMIKVNFCPMCGRKLTKEERECE